MASLPSALHSTQPVDLRALDYLQSTSANLICPICHAPMISPVQTKCLHTFCSACISLSLDRSPTCPVDRKPLTHDEVTPAPITLTNIVNDLLVFCPNRDRGCSTTCARWLIESHVREDCGYALVKYKSGGEEELLVMRKNSEEVECVHCEKRVMQMEMEEHYKECEKLESECDHCGITMPNSELRGHKLECPAEIIKCPASHFGCPFSSPRSEFDAHTGSCHFVALTPVLQLHTDRIANLELENRVIREKLDMLVPITTVPAPRTLRTPPVSTTDTTIQQQFNVNPMPEATTNITNDSDILTTEMQDYTYHIYSEYENLRADVERINVQLRDLDIKVDVSRINEGLRFNEELTGMRAAINGLRMQLHWAVARRGEGASSVNVGAATGGSGGSGNTASGDGRMSDTSRQIVKL